jgi:CheY-like chemotaxis protein
LTPTAWRDASPSLAPIRKHVAALRRDANRIGFAVQLALLRHSGVVLTQVEQPTEPLVQWLARQLDIPATSFADYARRPQTMTDHARLVAAAPGLRLSANSDLTMMVEAAAKVAWSTDRGQPITAAVVAELRGAKIILPAVGSLVGIGTNPSSRTQTKEGSRPVCIVVDIRLSGIDGLSLHRHLTSMGVEPATVIITGHGDDPMAARDWRREDRAGGNSRRRRMRDSILSAIAWPDR